jgi:acetylornithine deacetylase
MDPLARPNLEGPVAEFIAKNCVRWRLLLQELIRIPSHFGSEHAIVERVAGHIRGLGVRVERVPHDPEHMRQLAGVQWPLCDTPGRCSLVARIRGTGVGRSLAISTHLDVVPEGDARDWLHPPYAGHIDEERGIIYGRGAMDDKAGVVIALALLEMLACGLVRPAGDVVFHFVLEDETTGNGTLLCLDAGHGADAGLILDGTRKDKAINEHAGNMEFEVRLTGRPASVAVSHVGVNAAEMTARLLVRLRDATFALNATRAEPWRQFPSPYQLVIHKISSAGDRLTVPASAWAQCYVTFPPPDTLATMRARLQDETTRFAQEHDLPTVPALDWVGFATEPVRSSPGELEGFLQASAARLGLAPITVVPSTGTSDLRHFVQYGIPCLLYGPGTGFNPHRPDEHYSLEDLPTMARIYLDVIQSWCGLALPRRQSA